MRTSRKPQIGIASTWANLTPCNMHIAELAREAAAGVDAAGGKSVLFNTITVSDGISMGTPGMRYSLVSREVIADSIETVVGRGRLRRLRRHRRLRQEHAGLRHGDRAPESPRGVRLRRHHPARRAAARHRLGVRGGRRACRRQDRPTRSCSRSSAPPSPGPAAAAACTPPTPWPRPSRRSGLSLPDSSAQEAVERRPSATTAARAGDAVVQLRASRASGPRDILTRKAFENAITVVIALGGSTNAVLHLLAIAHEARVKLRAR